jgi:hypothetical protein
LVAETRSCGVAEVSTVEAIAGGGRGFLEAKKPEKTLTPWNKTVKEQVEMLTYNEESECGLIKEMKHGRRSMLGTFAFHVGRPPLGWFDLHEAQSNYYHAKCIRFLFVLI